MIDDLFRLIITIFKEAGPFFEDVVKPILVTLKLWVELHKEDGFFKLTVAAVILLAVAVLLLAYHRWKERKAGGGPE